MNSFPLRGVIGIVTQSIHELEKACTRQLQCIEIRADLLIEAGNSIEDVMAIVSNAHSHGLVTLFTLRHPTHGGAFQGSELERFDLNRRALNAGADVIDLEWGTQAANLLLAQKAPLILSYHDFNMMPDSVELAELTCSMSACLPLGIKVVPTAIDFKDALRMLSWVSDSDGSASRIGFAMGSAGSFTRILATAFGSAVTYASFGKPTAPGQVPIDELLKHFRVPSLNCDTKVEIIFSSDPQSGTTVEKLNKCYASEGINRVAIVVDADAKDEVLSHRDLLRVVDTKW